MDKLLKHIMNAKNVSNKFLPHLTKAQYGKQVKSNPGQTVVVDGKRMNTNSDEYEQVYKKGIGQWRKYDSTTGQWNLLANNLPSSAYNNAEFVSSERNLPEVTVSAKMNPFVSAARKKAKEQAGSLDAFRKQEEASYPKWYKNTSLYNPEKDSQTQEETYNSVVNRGTYQNLVDAIPQKENESRVNYINRFNNLAGKNAVSLARQANVTEPFDPNNLYKLGQWGWKGLNHIAAVNQAFSPSNTRGFRSTIQEGINRGNMPIPGMLSDDAKQIGITQPFDTVDDLAFRYGFKPLLKAGDNLTDPTGEQSRAFNSRYLGASETDKVFTSLMNPLNYIAGAEILKGAKGLGDAIKTPLRTASVAQKNLKDLNYAKKVYGPLGYKIPENLERIAQSDLLTDRTIRGLVNRDNSFYRGVSNLETLKQKLENKRPLITSKGPQGYDPMDTYNTLVDQLKKSGVDITNEEEVAKYMATHIPGETGGGRANLDENIFKKGLDALYTSNSEGTAEGYTYGKGFIVKAKKPTDFSFPDRKSWIDYNNPDIQARNKYRLPFLSSKPISWKTDYKKLDDKFINNYREELGAERLRKEYPDAFAFGVRHWENGNYPEVKKVFDRIGELRTASRENFSKAHDPLLDKIRKVDKRIESRVEKFKKSNMPMPVKFLQGITNPAFVRDMVLDQYYGNLSRKLRKSSEKEWEAASYIPYLERYPDLATVMPEADPYAHYLHIGKPGQKVLEPMSLRKISPDTWKRTSRAHDGKYSRQATRREFGGAYDNAEYNMGGQPCYECGGSVKRYDVGGYYDCPDQEKDPVTGKCKAEVVRGREANAANKAAGKEMNAWAKQVAAMDKELAKQYAAQDAGQLTFDYDWMQTPLDKADKKAAVAGYKQFFQQNPNVFVADDTSGYSPEQKYIIASKLKQRMSTPMGSKLVQQKYGVDPRFYDLQRIQSDFAPKMGGWDGMRNFLFNTYKQQGGQYDLPQAQWGSFINPVDMGLMASKVMNFFGLNKPKIVRTPASAPKRLSIRDPRKVMMTTGKPLRPNSDLVTGQYDSEHLGNLLTEAKRRKMSYNDMMNLAAMGFQETKWGQTDPNIGHTQDIFGDDPNPDAYENFINAYNAKMKDADRLKIKDEATRLQVYNGLGKVFPSTEADYHGFKMKKIYGVEVPKGGIDLRKNPLYGKQVIDIRDNVLKRNPEFMRYMDSTYRAPMPKEKEFANGGLVKMQRAGQYTAQRDATAVNIPVQSKMFGAQREIDVDRFSEDAFKQKYNMTPHQYKMRTDSNYAQAFERQMDERRQNDPNYSELNLPATDIRSKNYRGNPNLALIPKGATGPARAQQEQLFTDMTSLSAPLLPVKSLVRGLQVGKAASAAPKIIKQLSNPPSSIKITPEGSVNNYDPSWDTDIVWGAYQNRWQDTGGFEPVRDWPITGPGFRNFNSNFYNRTNSIIGNTVRNVDEKLGKLLSTRTNTPTFDPDEVTRLINENLSKGAGVKKENLPLQVRYAPFNNDEDTALRLETLIDNNKVGSIFLQRNMDPYKPKTLSQILLNKVPTPNEAWRNTPGFRKKGDFPFQYYDEFNPVKDPSGKVFNTVNDLYKTGVSGEFNKAINQALKEKGLGNVLSGGTGHSKLGEARWHHLVQKGLAEDLGGGYFKLKKQGGLVIDPRGQWAHPGKITRIPGSDITMQGVPYPVYGVGSNGQEQMMYPGQEYNFGGASYVDEYPIMQKGGWSGGGLSRSNLAMMSALNKDIKDQKARDAQVTISQYTPKPGDQQRMNANKDAYRKEQGKFLNRLADNQHMQAAGKNLPGAAEFALDVMTAGEAGVALKAAKPLLKAAGKYLTQKTPLRNASKFNPYALTDNMLFNKEGVVNRQMFGDEAFENFKQYGPTTRPNVSQYDQMMEFIKAPKSDVISGSGEVFQVAKTMEDGAFKYPYFQEGNLWYTGQQRNNLANQLGTERIITTPKSDIWFAPAGEGTVMHGDDLSQGLINSYSKGRRVLIPGSEYAKPSKYSVFEPHWWKGYKQVQEEGGQISMMANGGYTVTRSNDRKGKTHKVTGPGGVVKYFGDSKLGQHPKDPERKAAFYARHKKNLAGNPFFRAFARKTWQSGGQTDSTLENILEVFDPTGLSSWDDVYRSANDPSSKWYDTAIEVAGALPLVGKLGKLAKAGVHLKKYKGLEKAAFNMIPKSTSLSNTLQGAALLGRGSDAVQAGVAAPKAPFFPSAPPAGVGQFGVYAGMPVFEKKKYGGTIKAGKQPLEKKHGIKVTYKK